MAEQVICNHQVGGSIPLASFCNCGGVPKRSNGADCKSVGIAFGGSNPSAPIFLAGVAQLVEHWPSKPIVAGSSPVSRLAIGYLDCTLLCDAPT